MIEEKKARAAEKVKEMKAKAAEDLAGVYKQREETKSKRQIVNR